MTSVVCCSKMIQPSLPVSPGCFSHYFPPHSRLRNASMLYLWSLVGLFFGIAPLYFFDGSFVSLDLFFLVCTPVWKRHTRGKNCPYSDVMPACRCLMSLSAGALGFESSFAVCSQVSGQTKANKSPPRMQLKLWSLHSIHFNITLSICHLLPSIWSPGALQVPRAWPPPHQTSHSSKTPFQHFIMFWGFVFLTTALATGYEIDPWMVPLKPLSCVPFAWLKRTRRVLDELCKIWAGELYAD